MKGRKPSAATFRRLAATRKVTFREAVRIAAANGGRRSGQARREKSGEGVNGQQGSLFEAPADLRRSRAESAVDRIPNEEG